MTGFEQATLSQSIILFKKSLKDGYDHSATDLFGRTPMYGLRFCRDASVDDLEDVLREFMDAGANIDHIDSLGNTLLLMSDNDNLGVALVRVGACISYELQHYSKRALVNAAIFGCTRTMDAIIHSRQHSPDELVIDQRELDYCLDGAAKRMAYNPSLQDMSGIMKLVHYGANPNALDTLHYSAKKNYVLVQTLVSVGARTDTLAWDFRRGIKNTPLHRVIDMESFDVFQALVDANGADDADLCNVRDGEGATPLMALMGSRSFLYSNEHVITRFNWLMERGASCLPVDNDGRRLSSMFRSKIPPFRQLIDEKTREENWHKRRWIVLMRQRFVHGIRKKRRRYGMPTVVESVVGCNIDGVFRKIVMYL